MRVIAGTLSGRRFDGPDGYATRPTTDRVREAMFNALNSRDLIRGAVMADLFAGTGGLGIEALSRGAEHCTFVENNRSALKVLRSNLEALGLSERATVLGTDALTAMRGLDVDVVLADPPYEFDRWDDLLAVITAEFVAAESGREIEPTAGWQTVRARRYGRSWVTFLERADEPVDRAESAR